ncbi:hypothetical protein VT84_18185 [Gemmata sp. SH-PL17]|uniref:hypothetical protein n=1 Tax=Gemmata sp. SH-PL17 TaxID=1630693 RepID=UPI0004BC5E66|nr:hypothetical protein [Gemmata sp. SH-PL17]AMV26332.1 hypothetical protein VT84_18185 [Gemmata sp. SH-PL17]
MTSRMWVVIALIALVQATGCCQHCCCLSDRDSRSPTRDTYRDDRPPHVSGADTLPPANLPTSPGAAPSSGPPKVTGAYGGVE